MPLGELLTREGILNNYEPEASLHDTSQNVTFEWYFIDTKYDWEDTYEQANPPYNN